VEAGCCCKESGGKAGGNGGEGMESMWRGCERLRGRGVVGTEGKGRGAGLMVVEESRKNSDGGDWGGSGGKEKHFKS